MEGFEELELVWDAKEMSLSKMKEFEDSTREYSISDLEEAKKSIEKFGLIEPLCVNTDGTIIDGHLRYNSMIELGIKKCMVTFPERELTIEEVVEAYYRKNRNIAGINDIPILRKHFTSEELSDGGFSDFQIEEITTDLSDIEVDEKPKKFGYDLFFDIPEDKEIAEDLLDKLKEDTAEESIERGLIALIKKRKKDE